MNKSMLGVMPLLMASSEVCPAVRVLAQAIEPMSASVMP